MGRPRTPAGRRYPGPAAKASARDERATLRREVERLGALAARARADADAMHARTAFLSEASEVLASSLDYQATLEAVARLAVPRVADWCAVDLADAFLAGEAPAVVAHVDPASVERVRAMHRTWPPDRSAKAGVPAVLRTGAAELYGDVPDALLVAAARDEAHLGALRALGMRSAMVVPMPVRGRVLGAMTLVSTRESRRYGRDDLDMAVHLARRAGFAVDNARLYREAQRAAASRDEVLAIVSHDLKNPLASVAMSATLLQRAPDDRERVARYAETIRRSSARMDRLIRDLLDLSSIEAGRFAVERGPLGVRELLSEASALLHPLAVERSIDLEVEAPEDEVRLFGDRERILQVLSNLVGNALAFTPAGGRVGVRCLPARHGAAVFAVTDTGPGIPEADQPHVFGRFWKSRTSRRGTGLGLSISKGIVEAHGGRIWLESAPGRGATFLFTIPLAPGTACGLGAVQGEAVQGGGAP